MLMFYCAIVEFQWVVNGCSCMTVFTMFAINVQDYILVYLMWLSAPQYRGTHPQYVAQWMNSNHDCHPLTAEKQNYWYFCTVGWTNCSIVDIIKMQFSINQFFILFRNYILMQHQREFFFSTPLFKKN